jgi:uncharacterized protein YeaO (DUF488 family)
VERLWPRGISKERAALDLWLKDVAPSPELRRWYNHDPARWTEFQKRYEAELRQNHQAVETLRQSCRHGAIVTFVYAAHDEQHNSAVVLKRYLESHPNEGPKESSVLRTDPR